MSYSRAAWDVFGVRIWHAADREALDDAVWQAMKQQIDRRSGDGE